MAKRAEVDRKIAELRQIRSALDELIATCPGDGALRACTIIDALTDKSGTYAKVSRSTMQRSAAERSRQPTTGGHKVKTAIFKIDGMHCDGCARTIEALVAAERGVRKATVSFKTREARILFDSQAVGEDRLMTAIRQAGYSVVDQR